MRKISITLILSLLLSILLLSGCSLVRMPRLFGGAAQAGTSSNQSYQKEIIEDIKNGLKYYKVSKNSVEIIPKLTFAQKIGKWIGGLTTIGLILLVIGFFVAPGATLTILYTITKKALKTAKRAFEETAMAIKISGAKNKLPELEKQLVDLQSPETKLMVGAFKANLVK